MAMKFKRFDAVDVLIHNQTEVSIVNNVSVPGIVSKCRDTEQGPRYEVAVMIGNDFLILEECQENQLTLLEEDENAQAL